MDSPRSLKKDWVLSQDAFDTLLARLDGDPERAGQKYEQIRCALITFFECRGCFSPEDHADETVNRVARRLLEGKDIHTENPASYFYGVARNVLREYWDASGRAPASLDSVPPPTIRSHSPHRIQEERSERQLREQRLDCLERCLESLIANDRNLIAAYYQGDTGVKVENRKRLAERLGIPLNALRIRALRIREKLEHCVTRCMEASSSTGVRM